MNWQYSFTIIMCMIKDICQKHMPHKVHTGVHNAKAEECKTCQTIKINIDVGGLHGNQFAKIDPPK